jgi:hypothetical protein
MFQLRMKNNIQKIHYACIFFRSEYIGEDIRWSIPMWVRYSLVLWTLKLCGRLESVPSDHKWEWGICARRTDFARNSVMNFASFFFFPSTNYNIIHLPGCAKQAEATETLHGSRQLTHTGNWLESVLLKGEWINNGLALHQHQVSCSLLLLLVPALLMAPQIRWDIHWSALLTAVWVGWKMLCSYFCSLLIGSV